MQDSHGSYWFCSKPDGLFRVKETANDIFAIDSYKHAAGNNNSISNDNDYYSVEDKYGRLWIATFDGGINCIPDPQAGAHIYTLRQ
jgi:ligand-binding sensor domain-containing protein